MGYQGYDCIDGKCVEHEKGAFSDPSCGNNCDTKYDKPMFISALSVSGVLLLVIIITIFFVFRRD